jgi:hypothetical protein
MGEGVHSAAQPVASEAVRVSKRCPGGWLKRQPWLGHRGDPGAKLLRVQGRRFFGNAEDASTRSACTAIEKTNFGVVHYLHALLAPRSLYCFTSPVTRTLSRTSFPRKPRWQSSASNTSFPFSCFGELGIYNPFFSPFFWFW